MSWLDRLHSWLGLPPKTRLDPSFGLAAIQNVESAFREGKLAMLEDRLAAIADGNVLYAAIRALGRGTGRPPQLDHWLAERPESFYAHLVNTAQLTRWAWDARSAKPANQVSTFAFDIFHRRLGEARASSQLAARLRPDQALPWALQINPGRGLGLPHAEQAEIFAQCIARAPGLVEAYTDRLSSICQKWGGSHEAMFAFAREHAARPELALLMPMAHLEYMLTLDDPEAEAYRNNLRPQEEIATAFAAAESCAEHTARIRNGNVFAMVQYWFGMPALARRAMRMTDGIVTEMPWLYIGEPVAMYQRARSSLS
jgi:hypothetical protein